MKEDLEKEVEDKLTKLYLKEKSIYLKSKNPFYKKEKLSNDIGKFLEYCISERREWAKKYKEDEFWEYASYLGKMITRWGKRY